MDEREDSKAGGDDGYWGGRHKDQNLSQTVLRQAARIERLEAQVLGMQEITDSRLAGLRRMLRSSDGEAGAQWRRQEFLLSEVTQHLEKGETSLAAAKAKLAFELARGDVAHSESRRACGTAERRG
jgi:tryptophan 2,3-dioxygenase